MNPPPPARRHSSSVDQLLVREIVEIEADELVVRDRGQIRRQGVAGGEVAEVAHGLDGLGPG